MERYNPTAEIMSAIVNINNGPEITAYFANGTSATYSGYMIDLLKTDPAIEFITSAETGEILFPEF